MSGGNCPGGYSPRTELKLLCVASKKWTQFPGRRSTIGAPNHRGGGAANDGGGRQKVPTILQVLSSMQYICFRKTSGSDMGAPYLLLAPVAI